VTLEVVYVGNDDARQSVALDLVLPRAGAQTTRTVRLRGCADGCQLAGMSVTRLLGKDSGVFAVDGTSLRVLFEEITAGDRDLTDIAWRPDEGSIRANENNPWIERLADPLVRVTANRPDGLEVSPLPQGPTGLVLTAEDLPVRVITASLEDPVPLDLGSAERPADRLGEYAALPLVGGVGVLTDMTAASVASGPTVPSAEVQVVAAADTPAEVLDRLEDATGSTAVSLDDLRAEIGTAAGADQARAHALMAVACVLVALLALAAVVARHLRGYRRDVAALRVMGVGVATARRAGRTELVSLAALVVLATAVGGWLAVRLLLGGLPLVTPSAAAQALDTGPRLLATVFPALLAAGAVLVVGGRARVVREDATRPALLREEERR
jgi:hypothetical protein